MVLERMLWNFDFILYKIVFNYPELQFLETFYQGAKHFPEDSYFTTSINLNFLTHLSTPVTDPALPKVCHLNVSSSLTCAFYLAGWRYQELFHDRIPSPIQAIFIPNLFLGAEEWRGPGQHREGFRPSLESEEEMGSGTRRESWYWGPTQSLPPPSNFFSPSCARDAFWYKSWVLGNPWCAYTWVLIHTGWCATLSLWWRAVHVSCFRVGNWEAGPTTAPCPFQTPAVLIVVFLAPAPPCTPTS